MMHVWGVTDIGLVRKENQDAYLVRESGGYTICVVCDGMAAPPRPSGQPHRHGDLCGGAGAAAVAGSDAGAPAAASAQAVAAGQRGHPCRRRGGGGLPEHGTTLVAAVACDQGVAVTNVGDSRAYHIGEMGIVRVTKDHSLVESMVDRGDITAEEARRPSQPQSDHPGLGAGRRGPV